MPQKGNLAVFERWAYLQNQKGHAHQSWCTCTTYQSLLAWIYWAGSNPLNFSMTMDYSPCPKREILQFLKGSHISETEEAMPTKIDVHALDINPYLHEFFEPIPID